MTAPRNTNWPFREAVLSINFRASLAKSGATSWLMVTISLETIHGLSGGLRRVGDLHRNRRTCEPGNGTTLTQPRRTTGFGSNSLSLEHFQAKWTPVRMKKMRYNKDLEHFRFEFRHIPPV
jgi:hypothetical protein